MKKNYLLLTGLICAFAVSAQLPNNGFNSWAGSGKPAPFDWEEPTGWKSNNEVTEFIKAAVSKTTDAQEGALAAKIEPVNLFGTNYQGVICLGKPASDFSAYNLNLATGGIPFTSRPVALSGYYKLPGTGLGNGTAGVLLTRFNSTSGKRDTIAASVKFLPATSSNYTSFNLNIFYTSPDQPDTLTVYFISDTELTLYLDNVSIGPGTGLPAIHPQSSWQVYPVPATGPYIESSYAGNYVISDLAGHTVRSYTGTQKLHIDGLAQGTYVVRNETGESRKLIILH